MSVNDTDAPPSQPLTYAEFVVYLKASGFTNEEQILREWDWFTVDGKLEVYPEDLEW